MSTDEILVRKASERYLLQKGQRNVILDVDSLNGKYDILPGDGATSFTFKNQTPGSFTIDISQLIFRAATLAENLINTEVEKGK